MICKLSDAALARAANSRNVVNRSPMRATAISWVIACGLLCGGAGMLVAPQAAAEPGTVGNSHGGRDADGDAGSNGARGAGSTDGQRPGGLRKPRGTQTKPGTVRPDRGVLGAVPRQRPGGYWHPGLPGHHHWPHQGLPNALGPQSDWPVHRWPHDGSLNPGGPYAGWPHPVRPHLPFPHFPPIVLPPFPPFPPLPVLHWPRGPLGDDGVGIAAPPSARIDAPPPEAAGGGNGGGISVPAPRTIQLPGQAGGAPGEPPVVSADSGTVGLPSVAPPPVTMPPMIGLPPVFEAPMRPIGPSSEPGPRTGPGPGRESATTRERPPATSAGAGTEMPQSTRVGYPRYLREAKMGEVAAVALPGFAGILALTALGGVVGYRQARAGHVVRTAGTTRFMQ
jgi:hypothetical protein